VRAVEARFYQDLDLPAPLLDLGCGDGHFASLTFDRTIDVGLDPWTGPIRQARRHPVYRGLVQAEGGAMPFPDGCFASALSNSVLEHIPDVEVVLGEAARVLKLGAPFVFCVPNHRFIESLSIGSALERARLRWPAGAYRAFFNRISRHRHCDPPETWQARLERAGFRLERWWHYLPPRALHVVEWGHYFGLPSLVCRLLFKRWILVPSRWNLALTERLLRGYYQSGPISEEGVYTFFIARRATGLPGLAD
jgi:SAM-dependent methyltransferase